MKVLIADTFEASGLEALKAAGCEVLYQPELAGDSLVPAIASSAADVLVVRSTKVTEGMLDAGRLSLIVRAGAGVNTIDVPAASRRGIYVSNCPGRNAIAVAELAFGLILALDRRIPDNVADLRAGRWNKQEYSRARGLHGRTLGLLGFGHIGQEMARRARGFGMPAIVWSPRFLRDGPAALAALPHDVDVTVLPSPEEVAERSDVLSLHLALAPETRNFVGAAILGRLRPGTLFVNTARAELVDDAALADAVDARGIRVAIDVFPGEPAEAVASFSPPIVNRPNVYGTHHIGASTDQAQEAIAAEAVRVIRVYQETGKVPNVVNLSTRTPATHRLVVRHRDRPGVLAHVFDQLRSWSLNVQETENVIFEGAEAAVARINLDGEPPPDLLRAIQRGSKEIFSLQVVKNIEVEEFQEYPMPTTTRIYNFSAGPAVLPLPVLQEAQRNLISLPDVGMSVMEISHRSKTFEDLLSRAIEDIRALAGIPAHYRILMLQGGATLQFSMVPMNLLGAGASADYVDTGSWSDKAIKEAKKVGKVNVAASTRADSYTRIPAQPELKLTAGAAYLHITTNNTIEGTEWKSPPDVGDVPLVADTSSDMFSGPIDVGRFGLIYAGAQKNLGPSGVTLVIIREDLLARSSDALPIMLNYKVHAENNSLYNTPNTFGIYILGLTVKWLRSLGGLPAIARINQRKAGTIYAEIDRTGFYRGTAQKDSRSVMNVTFRLGTEELENLFVKESTAAGLDGLKGHRAVGGMRASIYNAFPEEGVDALVDFMREFERKRG